MKIKLIGLGKMGYNLALNMQEKGFTVVGYDVCAETREKIEKEGISTVDTLEKLCDQDEKNIFWLMLPAGTITNNVLDQLLKLCKANDYVIDGGNSDHRSSLLYGQKFEDINVYFFDFGTSGGVFGARHGASFMCGGHLKEFNNLIPLLDKITLNKGYIYTGKTGSGHYLKLVHNAMLYGYMQTLGEGFELLASSEFDYDLKEVANSLATSSVIRGWLLELLAKAFDGDAKLESIAGEISASKTTAWTLETACEKGIPIPVIYNSLMMRYRSKQNESFSAKVIAALRNQVGGYKPKIKD